MKTETIAEVCRYTDEEGTLSTMQTGVETTALVDRSDCCNNAVGNANLLSACSTDTTKPLSCFVPFEVITVDEITFKDGMCF